ncbi:MAG: alpha-amylase family glycosyl hydrolase [Capsulimonadaceae bacterium]|nr:alpha-amylase family glycosyl hydrolase [Capsulimonadaceae bacterium]
MLKALPKVRAFLFCLTILSVCQGVSTQQASAHSKYDRSAPVIYSIYLRIFSPTGDFNGAISQLPRLQRLGVNVLWLHPVTPVGKPVNGHPSIDSVYCVHDYYGVEPRYGAPADLKRFVGTAHKLGMRVILDEVLNHTSWDNALITDHPEYYVHTDGNSTNPKSIAQAFGWTDVAQLNYANHDVWRYMDRMLAYWVTEYNIDGFRFDACDNPAGSNRKIPADFWQQAGDNIRRIKPDLFLLGECQSPELSGKPFDIDYTWNVYKALKSASSGASATSVVDAWNKIVSEYPPKAQHMMIQDDFDEVRDVLAFHGIDGAKAAAVFNFTIGGVPLINNGMEVGNTGSHSMIDWDRADPSIAAFYRDLIKLRAQNAALRDGSLTWRPNSTPDQVLTYTRQSGKSQFLIVINLSMAPAAGKITLSDRAFWQCVFPETRDSKKAVDDVTAYSLQPKQFAVYRVMR